MNVIQAEHAGFCFGVARAIKIARQVSEEQCNSSIHTLGPLIHNPQVVNKLKELNIKSAERIEDIEQGAVIIRSHGVSPQIIEDAENKGLKVVDATCPFVKRTQKRAQFLFQHGYDVLIIGEKEHPEVKGIMAYTDHKAFIVSKIEEIEILPKMKKVGVVAQTTQSIQKYKEVIYSLLPQIEELRAYNTICTTTVKRQQETYQLAKQVPVMLVIGGYNSANTKRLADICRRADTETYHIETADDICFSWFKNYKTVGITAGASTPEWIIKEVKNKMKDRMEEEKLNNEEEVEMEEEACELEDKEVSEEACELENNDVVEEEESIEEEEDEVVEEPVSEEDVQLEEEAEEEEAEEDELIEEEDEEVVEEESQEEIYEDMPDVAKGEKVTGTVVQVTDSEVLVDIGYKSEAVIPINELAIKPVDSPEEVVNEGDEIEAEVTNIDQEDETIYLSKREIDFDKVWEEVFNDFDEKNTIEAKVTKRVKGGLVVDLNGLRGFVPGSQVAIRYIEDFDQFIGQTHEFKIIEVDREQNNIVLSRKEVLEDARAGEKEKTLDELEEGQIKEGVVTKLVDFGAFVDIGGIEGLLHISEMSWSRIQHPSDILTEGEEIEVMVLDVNREEERISLGLKQVKTNPWIGLSERYSVGDIIESEITKLVSFGAFARIEEGIEGLIHISQLAQRHIEKPEEVVSVGDEVKVKVVSINEDEQKIGLSMKEVEQDESMDEYSKDEDEGGITIGDMVGDLFSDDDE